ncbi:GNAT family N-acetyltransferase [Halobaculum sp. CBA1158]|uniref:GNAT family N-acetyltransferase n=1 Tax=Halobaculum sp. CBA1158 TaxID=2904243 RepID=UPI001F29B7D4|nr:GNAT family N-acetyltransferase [Halobaculum sp. CBA1158]UIP00935.1 GNAT family N-acetyltransferase [Halobaculum sp. CBA1158]
MSGSDAGGGDGADRGGDADGDAPVDHEFTVRQARPADVEHVVAFTQDTWGDRHGDYMPDVFSDWVETDGPRQHTLVVDVDGGDDVAGVLQCVLLSDTEAWAQGMRVNPDYRGRNLSPRLSRAALRWARDRGAVVCRNMVFSWNMAGLGQSRAVGFGPCTEFRWLQPAPDPDASPDLDVVADPDAAWAYWSRSDAREHLRGLAMDSGESWACSELTRGDLRDAVDRDGLFAVVDGGTRAMSALAYTYDRESDDGDDSEEETWGVYHAAAWDDTDALEALADAVARDAAERGIDNTRILIPEGVRWVSDAAATRTPVSDEPDFVTAADLTDESIY